MQEVLSELNKIRDEIANGEEEKAAVSATIEFVQDRQPRVSFLLRLLANLNQGHHFFGVAFKGEKRAKENVVTENRTVSVPTDFFDGLPPFSDKSGKRRKLQVRRSKKERASQRIELLKRKMDNLRRKLEQEKKALQPNDDQEESKQNRSEADIPMIAAEMQPMASPTKSTREKLDDI